ncbi:MAG: sulfatase [Acidobacteriota bacterium]
MSTQGGDRRRARSILCTTSLLLGVVVLGCAPESPPQPNVLLVVVDTLRADHLTTYGYARDTSPRVQSLIADQGVVVETAYAQAPWTLPSMASLLTGLPPDDLLDVEGRPWGVPSAARTLAERFVDAGWATAGFVANPTMHAGNGFAQGFEVFESAPYDLASMALPADRVQAQALDWLETAPAEPFFLYVHYLDPHDPYDNAEIPDGRSPFFPDYDGPISGGDAHGLYLGELELSDPERDVEHLRALYDSEIRYVDRFVGELIDALGPRLDNTLIVFTSDHGEEFYENGSFKHGETLYDELIHVPLIFRWDGELPAGRRVEGTARLLDIVPTLIEAAGLEPGDADSDLASSWSEGMSLLPALRGGELDERPAWARHFSAGPERVARMESGSKAILFDRYAPFKPADTREAALWRRDVDRMPRFEAEGDLDDPMQASAELAGRLDRWREGLRLVLSDAQRGGRFEAELRFENPPTSVEGLFLGSDDRFELVGDRLRLAWLADEVEKGVLVRGAVGGVLEASARLNGAPLPMLWGDGIDGASRRLPLGLRDVLVESYPPRASDQPALHGWVRRPQRLFEPTARDAETESRLRSLGYAE